MTDSKLDTKDQEPNQAADQTETTAAETAPVEEAEVTDIQVEETETKELEPEVVGEAKFPELRAGYTVRLHLLINDGKKERIQVFEGIILGMSGTTPETRTITVRKVSKGFGVEKIIPLAMPTLQKIEVVKKARVRQSKLYYLRNHKKRLREELVLHN